ncbi:ABC transporter ATP-binding protein [Neomegalonema sp.]|uniref:ABC transporter ATP-binding protein n=1 Tax=Neomegalonema sp. TaxID=2039713 RepID=UPI00261ACB1A|nr:ABC transporter ATP-binding protein [Neomegalonema sp.]MDD2868580.1 ABC transporter ATP-binding protein [Neomegalonema sp.]
MEAREATLTADPSPPSFSSAVSARRPLFEARGIVKRYGSFTANDHVDLTILPGERHALLGENGAGKSTFVKMIYGALQPTEGEFFWEGEPLRLSGPAEARRLGIGMAFQHFSVFEGLSALENVALALPPEPLAALDRRVREVSGDYGLPVDPSKPVHALSVGERQRVELLRCLLQNPRLLILDEPTSVLTPQEAETLFRALEKLSAEGCAILYISHRLEEVRALCSRATILRRGKVTAEVDPRATTARALAEAMVGAEILDVKRPSGDQPRGEEILQVERLSLPADGPFGVALKEISFSLRGGEILGVAGVAGEGQNEFMDALTGERRAPEAGMIRIAGVPAGRLDPTGRRRLGAAFAPEERNGHGAVGDAPLSEALFLTRRHEAGAMGAGGWLSRFWAAGETRRIRERFDVRAAGDDPPARSLSGGNLQKFLMGREIVRAPKLLIAAQPGWGVDAGAAAAIQSALRALADQGAAVLVVSQDLDEIFALADRIAVISRGRLSEAYPAVGMTPERVGLLMGAGHSSPEAAA